MNSHYLSTSKSLGNNNLFDIFKLIHQKGEATRNELIAQSGYSSGTISNHVSTLIDRGLVVEKEKMISQGGRRPVMLRINPEGYYIFAVKIEITRTELHLLDLELNTVEKREISYEVEESYKRVINFLNNHVEELITKHELENKDILGCGLSVPALVDTRRSVIYFAPNLRWQEKKIVEDLDLSLEFPVFVGNDAKLGAITEKYSKSNGAQNLVYISVNEGIGCGIVINDEIYLGSSTNAGEFGHVIIEKGGSSCHCGNEGCWETLASESRITGAWKERTGENLSKKEIYELGREGDEIARDVFQEVAENIGLGVANIINSLSPEKVVIGGGILNIQEYIESTIARIVSEKALDVSFESTELEYSRYLGRSEIYGAGYMIIENCLMPVG